MGKYIYKGAERYNQLNYEHNTPQGIISVIDDGHCLTIFTKDKETELSNCKMSIDAANGVRFEGREKIIELEKENRGLKAALKDLLSQHERECWLDHSGTCQEHGFTSVLGCPVKHAFELIEEK